MNNLILTMKKISLAILIVTLFSIASLSFATVIGPGGAPITSAPTDEVNIDNPLNGISDISILIDKIIDFLFGIAILVTPIIIVYAGFVFITSAGNEEKIKTAQKVLIWALIGFAIVLIAKSVPAIIQEFLSGSSTTTTTTHTLPPSIQI